MFYVAKSGMRTRDLKNKCIFLRKDDRNSSEKEWAALLYRKKYPPDYAEPNGGTQIR